MNPYAGLDTGTLGQLAQAGIDPNANMVGPIKSPPTSYPTYPNSAGLGSQTAGNPPADNTTQQTLPPPSASSLNSQALPDVSVRGMSPYSLLGDANYRAR